MIKLAQLTQLEQISNKHLLAFLLFSSIFVLTLAYISQYGFDLQPCILCLHQRKPFFAIIAITALTLLIPYLSKYQKLALNLSILLLLTNAVIATYNVGVEKKIFQGPTHCSDLPDNPTTIEELKELLLATKAVRCDEPAFTFLTISMAGWNVIYCLLLAVIITFLKRRK